MGIDFVKYVEAGYSVIPIHAGEKKPMISRWDFYSQELPTLEEAEKWSKIEDCGIGLVCGPASGVMALDTDTDNARSLEIVNYYAPSPVRRKGQKGDVRYFKYDPKFNNFSDHPKGIELFVDSRQTVLPPSIHKITKQPYVWLSVERFPSFCKDDLPELVGIEFIKELPIVRNMSEFHEIKKRGIGGRNDKLKSMIVAIHKKGLKSEDEIAQEILEFDKNMHGEHALFQDLQENRTGNAYENAKRFTRSILKSINKKTLVNIPTNVTAAVSKENFNYKRTAFPYPKLTGTLNQISEDLQQRSYSPVPVFFDAASIILVSTFLCGRWAYPNDRLWPNVNILLLGNSGLGKEDPNQALINILEHEDLRDYNHLGQTDIVSAVSMIEEFPKKRIQLHLYDEFSGHLKNISAASNGKSFSHVGDAIMETIKIFPKNGAYYGGRKKGGNEERGKCYGPVVNFMASTQPDRFIETASRELFSNGFMPRVLFVYADHAKEITVRPKSIQDVDSVVQVLTRCFPSPLRYGPEDKIVPREMVISDEPGVNSSSPEKLDGLMDYISRDFGSMLKDKTVEEARMWSRASIYTKKLAMIFAWSDWTYENQSIRAPIVIKRAHFELARDWVIAAVKNALLCSNGALAESRLGRLETEIVEYVDQIRSEGVLFIGATKFFTYFKSRGFEYGLIKNALKGMEGALSINYDTNQRRIYFQ